jgi:outer membrane protein OmpA-like peptidoglycan-associated protein
MKLLKYIVLLLIALNLNAQEKKTNWSFGGAIYGTGNIYSSSFKQISDVPNCCTEFKGAFALGFGILGFGEYSFKEQKFPYNWKAGVGLSYGDISAKFSETANIGNVIIGNTYVKGQSEYNIDVTLKGLGIEPYASFEIIKDIPLSVKIGFQLFIPTTKKYDQAENLINPSNATFENLKRIRNSASGDIPQFNGAIVLPSLGLKYDLFNTSDIIFSGIANYYFGIHNVVSNIDWKVNYFNAGLAMTYRVPEAAKLPPPPPPEPELPAPPRESIFTYDLKVLYNGVEVGNYGNVEYKISRDKLTFKTPVISILYYKYNTSEFADYETTNQQLVNGNLIKKLIFIEFNKNKESKLKIINSYLTSENKDVVDSRVNNFIRLFQKAFVDDFKVSSLIIEENPIDDSNIDKPELLEEADNIKFQLIVDDKITNILINENVIYKNITGEKSEFKAVPIINADAQPARFMGDLDLNGKTQMKLDNDHLSYIYEEKELQNYTIDQGFYGGKTLRMLTDVVDSESKTKSIDFQINIEDKITDVNSIDYNTYSDSANTYILGFFDFDESEFSSINPLAIEEFKKAKEKGLEVKLVSSTDNIGTEDYNRKLAQKRYNTALRVLKANRKDVNFEFPENYYFDNKFPQGRAYNRSVMIKVMPK